MGVGVTAWCTVPTAIGGSTTPLEAPGFGALLLETTLILIALCVLAYICLRFVSRRMLNAPSKGNLQLLARLALDTRHSACVVKAGSKVLLLGVGEADVRLISELDPEEWPSENKQPNGFSDILSAKLKAADRAEPAISAEHGNTEQRADLSPREGAQE